MCGIVGYIGTKNSVPILIDGLKRLEYRGYDSAGIGIIKSGNSLLIKNFKNGIFRLNTLWRTRISTQVW